MSTQTKVIRLTNKANDNVRIQLLRSGAITVSIYGKGGDTAKKGNMKQLTVVSKKFGLTQKAVLSALGLA